MCVIGFLWWVLWPELICAQLWLPGRIAPPFSFPLITGNADVFSRSVFPSFAALDNDFRAGLFIDKPLQVKNVRSAGAALLVPFKSMVFFSGIMDAGNKDFHQSTYSIGLAKKAGELCIGSRAFYFSQSTRGYGSTGNFSMEVNILFPMVKDIFFFADVAGIGSTVQNEKAGLPVSYSMGIIYKVSEEVEAGGIWKKIKGIPSWMEVQLYYRPLKQCSIQASFISHIQSLNLAISYRLSFFSLSAAIRYQQVFGPMATTALSYHGIPNGSTVQSP